MMLYMDVQPHLCQTWQETRKAVFLVIKLILDIKTRECLPSRLCKKQWLPISLHRHAVIFACDFGYA